MRAPKDPEQAKRLVTMYSRRQLVDRARTLHPYWVALRGWSGIPSANDDDKQRQLQKAEELAAKKAELVAAKAAAEAAAEEWEPPPLTEDEQEAADLEVLHKQALALAEGRMPEGMLSAAESRGTDKPETPSSFWAASLDPSFRAGSSPSRPPPLETCPRGFTQGTPGGDSPGTPGLDEEAATPT
eukprot:1151078-Pyramimonas_sp.AAC.1